MTTPQVSRHSRTVPARLRVLLAEDHEPMRDLLKLVLKGNHDVVGAHGDGKDLWEAASRQNPHVILLDISMPEVGGFEAARILRSTMPDVPLVFVTHHTEKAYLEEAIRIGVRGYVLKTRIVQELRLAIREVWQGGMFVSPGILPVSL
jgi:DNA-binding NarL/FixJ family response regulator